MKKTQVDIDAIAVDDEGRVILSDAQLEAMAFAHELATAGSNSNRGCTNFQGCGGSSNSGGCTNVTGACGGATNSPPSRCDTMPTDPK